jgi:hypothetical protein
LAQDGSDNENVIESIAGRELCQAGFAHPKARCLSMRMCRSDIERQTAMAAAAARRGARV